MKVVIYIIFVYNTFFQEMNKFIFITSLFIFSISLSCQKKSDFYIMRYKSNTPILLNLNKEIRNGFITSFPTQFNWKFFLSSQSIMEFSIAVDKDKLNKLPKNLLIVVKEQKSNKILLKKKLNTHRVAKKFFELKINLNNFSGKLVNLNFELKDKAKNNVISNAIYWEQPKIFPLSNKIEKNIIIITIDTLRADHLSYNGYFRRTSPNIDEFSIKSINFKNSFSVSSATWPSLTSLMTSVYPSQHGVIFNGYKLTKKIISLPEVLMENNYQTAAILGNMKRASHNGYDYIFKAPNDELVVSKAISKIQQYKKRRFFIWIHFLGPHASYSAPEIFYSKHNLSPEEARLGLISNHYKLFENNKSLTPDTLDKIIHLYDINIEYTDYLAGLILKKIYELKLNNNTIIVISADHGEELCQHHNFLYHSGSLYDATLHIPLLIYIPHIKTKKSQINNIVSIIDIAPTILDILNLPIPSSFKGESLLKTLYDKPLKRKYAFSETHAQLFSLRNQEYRIIYNSTKKPINVLNLFTLNYSEELYRHPDDYLELNNIRHKKSHIYNEYLLYLQKWIYQNLPSNIPHQIIDPAIIEQLKALGYIR